LAERTSPHLNPYVVLAAGVLAIATAAVFIRLAQGEEVASLVIAAGRLLVATLVLTPAALGRYRYQYASLTRREVGLCVLSGAFLAGHFAFWVTSLEYTSVITSVVLTSTNPLFVAALSLPLLGERISRWAVAGIVLAIVGSVMVALSGDAGDPPTRPAPFLGNSLAFLGSISVAIYVIIGRRIRSKLAVVPYIWLVYGSAGVVLLPFILLRGDTVIGYSVIGYVWILALGLIPQLVGHSSFNYALGYLPAALVSVVGLSEPVGSGILAYIVFGETPSLLAVLGAVFILSGVGMATLRQKGSVT
jgi:drug/metabolite transporter (DMT)-like permease